MKIFKPALLSAIIISIASAAFAQSATIEQTIKGIVIDSDSRKPLSAATIELVGQHKSVLTDSLGNFRFTNAPLGRQVVQVSLVGYEPVTTGAILVTSGKEVFLEIPMKEKITVLNEVKIVGNKNRLKASNEFATVSARSFSVEETKRYPAAAFDPGRMAQNFAGVSNNGDGDNSIVVRGNSPQGVLWRLEGIEIASPNHFGGLGSSGGAISMLSSSTLGGSDFYTGAFPAEFGNALSGAFDLKFRNGNKDKREHSFMIGGLGIEVASEGPFKKGGQSSYLVNYRYSTLSLLKGFLDLQGVLPEYQDLSFKLNFPVKKGVFSVFGIGGLNKATKNPVRDSTKWDDDNPNYVVNNKGKYGVAGLSYQVFLTERSYLKTIVSANINSSDELGDTLHPRNDYAIVHTFNAKFSDNAYRASVLYNNKINSRHSFRAGINVSRLAFDYSNNFLDDRTDSWENILDSKGETMYYQAYAQWKHRMNNKWTVNAGLHSSLFALNNSKSLEPRASVSYQLNQSQSVTVSGGLHTKPQALSTYFYDKRTNGGASSFPNKELDLSRAVHAVIAYDKSFRNGTRFRAETYYQRLSKIPVERKMNGFFSAINAADIYGLYEVDSALVSEGKGKNYGLDLSLERPFSKGHYFLFTGSLFRSTYTTYSRKEYNTKFNRNYQLNAVAGKEWKISRGGKDIFGLNGKILASGSLRNSPIDLDASRIEGEAVYVAEKYFTLKGDPYFRFDIGISYKMNRRRSTHTLSLDVQNISNHQNLYYSYYDNDKGEIKKVNQMGLFPIFNYRVEF